jgi:hypothetical protein
MQPATPTHLTDAVIVLADQNCAVSRWQTLRDEAANAGDWPHAIRYDNKLMIAMLARNTALHQLYQLAGTADLQDLIETVDHFTTCEQP